MMIVTAAGMTATMIWEMAAAAGAAAVVVVAGVAAGVECTVVKSAASASRKLT